MKKAYVYCGLPGSGKSTHARTVAGCVVIETDDFWINPDTDAYEYDADRAGESHGWNLVRWINLCQGGFPRIACANTNLTMAEIAPYVAIAQSYGFAVVVRVIDIDFDLACERNTHDVPLETMEKMAQDFDELVDNFPPWWSVERFDAEV